MRYMFDLQRNIFMYNHLLTVSDGKKSIKQLLNLCQRNKNLWRFGLKISVLRRD